MTAPTLERNEIPNPGTPVIIKIGGGERKGGNVASIFSEFVAFVDQTGGTWHEASSILPLRIKELTVKENDVPKLDCKVPSESNVLRTLKVYFESGDVLELGEVVDTSNSIFLQAKSTNIFTAEKRPEAREWNKSTAAFTSIPVKAEFMQRQVGAKDDESKLEYYFTPGVILEFDLGF